MDAAVINSFYFCSACKITFLNQSLAHKHMISNHNTNLYGNHTTSTMEEMPLRDTVVIKDEGTNPASGRKKWRLHCLLCAMEMKSKPMLEHLRVNTDTMTVTCVNVCPDGSRIDASIHHNHYKTFRKQADEFVCHECGSSFQNRRRFQAHIERGHDDEGEVRTFHCDSCPYTSNNQHFLKLHLVLTHHGQPVEPKTYVCEDCGKGFTSSGGMRQHRENWHQRSKQHKCRFCEKIFYTRGNLKKHIKVHSQVRRFSCQDCNQAFKSAYNLKVHQRIHTGFKPYRCQWCDVAFAQKNSLNVHMKKHEVYTASRRSHLRDEKISPHRSIPETKHDVSYQSPESPPHCLVDMN